jgi:6-phosphogluconolactonase (cycloisomerase 2 family)
VTDLAKADVLTYSVGSGPLTPVAGSPFPSGNAPAAIVIDGTGKYAYVANSQDATLTAYSVSNGVLTFLGSSPTPVAYATGTQPVAIGIDPSLNQYLYTANFLGNNVSGFEVNATNGTLLNSQFSPFSSNANPTAVAAIPHGAANK